MEGDFIGVNVGGAGAVRFSEVEGDGVGRGSCGVVVEGKLAGVVGEGGGEEEEETERERGETDDLQVVGGLGDSGSIGFGWACFVSRWMGCADEEEEEADISLRRRRATSSGQSRPAP